MAVIDRTGAEFVREAAQLLRELALRAPDALNELRRFADELDGWADRLDSEPEE